jgi:hypothetical protein
VKIISTFIQHGVVGFYDKEFLSQLRNIVTAEGERAYSMSVTGTLIPDFLFTCRLCCVLGTTENVPVINLFVFDRT